MEVPDFLETQIREGKVVLVLGAGASRGAIDSGGKAPPDGKQLARLIADRFLGGGYPDSSLNQIGEYAISESSLVEVQEFIRLTFEGSEPASFHRLIPKFRWHGLATTNYDRIIEKAYEGEANPGDKKLHYELAKHLLRREPDAAGEIEYHLQRAFTVGDSNYDAQLLYARQLYVRGNINGAKERFKALASAKISPSIRDRAQYPLPGWHTGSVTRSEATYCFVARDGLADWVFAHRSDVDPDTWKGLRSGSRVKFQIAFTMKGPAAQGLSAE